MCLELFDADNAVSPRWRTKAFMQAISCVLTRSSVEQISTRRVGSYGVKDALMKAFTVFHSKYDPLSRPSGR